MKLLLCSIRQQYIANKECPHCIEIKPLRGQMFGRDQVSLYYVKES